MSENVDKLTVQKMPATLTLRGRMAVLEVDLTDNALITDDATLRKKFKEFGIVRTPKVSLGKSTEPVAEGKPNEPTST